jgi:Williams-Beuren syndrome DDT (WSD), D-TOX E motif
MESLPTLQSLHNAVSQENAMEAEDELLSVITHLLVCAIEDPGIPNPNRHLTLLGQTLRQADITHQNVSEILRIYLYSVATGEVRQQTGINFEREKCGKFGDLHQNDIDERQTNITNSKNLQFYEVLHDNDRYKLSESLKDKPFVALNSTVKAQILAMLCNDLLLNKAVCRQIEGGLESQAVLKKEKFLLDNKVRKYKSLVARKQKIEQYEKSQQLLKKEAELGENNSLLKDDSEIVNDKIQDDGSVKPQTEQATPDKVEEIPTKPLNDINLTSEKLDDDNTDDESEELEEDEDTAMSSEEVQKKLEKILEQSFHTKKQLQKALNSLRAKHYGQDRYWRRYFYLPKCGGIYVEGLESAQNDLYKYQNKLEEVLSNGKLEDGEEDKAEAKCEEKPKSPADEQIQIVEDINNKSDMNSIVYNTKMQHNSHNSSTTMMNKPSNENEDFDIEDSIPTAILVQKGNKLDDSKFVEINHVVPSNQQIEEQNDYVDSEMKIKNEMVDKIKSEKELMEFNDHNIKEEFDKQEDLKENYKLPQLLPKWFSLIEKEVPLPTTDCPIFNNIFYLYQNTQCKDELIIQGQQWEIQNNLHFYDAKVNEKLAYIDFKNESVLSTSGLNEKTINRIIDNEQGQYDQNDVKDVKEQITETVPMNKSTFYDQSHCFTLPPIQNMSINNLSVFVQCENLNSTHMTPEEQEAVEDVKINGIKKSLEATHVEKELRHGWWKISEIEDMNSVIKSLHTKGVREKNLRQNLLSALSESIDLTIPCPVSNPRAQPTANGFVEPEAFNAWNPRVARRVEQQLLDNVEALEDKIANASMQIKGWIVPQRDNDSESDDALESIDLNLIKDRILNLEAAIERRYLKPPLGNK